MQLSKLRRFQKGLKRQESEARRCRRAGVSISQPHKHRGYYKIVLGLAKTYRLAIKALRHPDLFNNDHGFFHATLAEFAHPELYIIPNSFQDCFGKYNDPEAPECRVCVEFKSCKKNPAPPMKRKGVYKCY